MDIFFCILTFIQVKHGSFTRKLGSFHQLLIGWREILQKFAVDCKKKVKFKHKFFFFGNIQHTSPDHQITRCILMKNYNVK